MFCTSAVSNVIVAMKPADNATDINNVGKAGQDRIYVIKILCGPNCCRQ